MLKKIFSSLLIVLLVFGSLTTTQYSNPLIDNFFYNQPVEASSSKKILTFKVSSVEGYAYLTNFTYSWDDPVVTATGGFKLMVDTSTNQVSIYDYSGQLAVKYSVFGSQSDSQKEIGPLPAPSLNVGGVRMFSTNESNTSVSPTQSQGLANMVVGGEAKSSASFTTPNFTGSVNLTFKVTDIENISSGGPSCGSSGVSKSYKFVQSGAIGFASLSNLTWDWNTPVVTGDEGSFNLMVNKSSSNFMLYDLKSSVNIDFVVGNYSRGSSKGVVLLDHILVGGVAMRDTGGLAVSASPTAINSMLDTLVIGYTTSSEGSIKSSDPWDGTARPEFKLVSIEDIATGGGDCGGGTPTPPAEVIIPKCKGGTNALLDTDGFYYCEPLPSDGEETTSKPIPRPPADIIENIISVGGGGGTLIEIPRYEHNHIKESTTLTGDAPSIGTNKIGDITDKSSATSLTAQYTNVPDSGIIYIPTDGFQPQTLVKKGHDSVLLPSGNADVGLAKEVLNKNGMSLVVSLIDTSKHNIDGKSIGDFQGIYKNCGSVNGVKCTKVDANSGVANLNDFKIDKPGRFLLVTYIKSGSDEKVIYKIIDARSQSEFSGLPVQNRMTVMVDNTAIREKKTQNSHQFSDMLFTFLGSSKEKSMNVPSINNAQTGNIVVGSTNKGLRMFDSSLKALNLLGTDTSTLVVTDVAEVNGTNYVAVATSNKGLLILDTKTKQVTKINNLLSETLNSVKYSKNLIYCSFEGGVAVYYFDVEGKALHLRDSITSQEIFGTNEKLGQLNVIGSKIAVNSHHTSPSHKMAIISKY